MIKSSFSSLRGAPAWALYLGGLALAGLCEHFELRLIYDLSFSFSSIFLLLLLLWFGLGPALAGAAVLYTFSFLVMGEPLLDMAGMAEVLFLGLVLGRKRTQLLLWDSVYWLTAGLPLLLIAYYAYYRTLTIEFVVLVTIAATNGLFNALIAEMTERYVPLRRWLGLTEAKERPVQLGQVLFHLSISAVAVPFLIFMVLNSWYGYRTVVHNSHQTALNIATGIKKELGKWGDTDITALRNGSMIQLGKLQEIINRYTTEDISEIVLTDGSNHVLATTSWVLGLDPYYDWRSNRSLKQLSASFYESRPLQRSHWLTADDWKKGSYLYNDTVPQFPLQIHIGIPIQMYMQQMYQQYLDQLKYLLFFAAGAALLALLIGRAIVRSLSHLAVATTRLTDKLYQQEAIEWPQSRIVEVISLVNNFRQTSHNLLRMFAESQEMNRKLQEQTAMLRQSEEKLQHLAYYDVLTDLPNRLHFSRYLQELITGAKPPELPIAVVFADLNRFKDINDSLGHAVGDALLQTIAGMFARLVSDGCKVFRLGGDEFVFVLEAAREDKLRQMTQRIFSAFAEPIRLKEEMTLYVTVSLGVSLYPRDGQDLGTIVKNADMAMYVAKEQGGNAVYYFNEDLNAAVTEKMFIDIGIREALGHEQFRLFYQPKVDPQSQRICGIEALIRWQHPELGTVPPTKFIPLAEESGLILEIDEWVVREACRQNRAWQQAGLPKVPVAVNISGRHFYQGNLHELICEALEESGLEAKYLQLEITEGVLIKNVEHVLDMIFMIIQLGVQISIDDFGTGYSSLNQLQRLPIYEVKLDRSFIQGIDRDRKKSSIVRAVIDLAHSMNLRVVAEGVETMQEMMFLVQLNCDELQGYLYSKPLPAEEFSALLSDVNRFVPLRRY
ncbi:EAL domain-containing protein [Paenibacillus athensensis]|uniref:putative bifunctional diguanylate cyclase/phosphodiesterase n=1 Tax=Paenibacillus athensensis TaxID=1967502 RepID=UPI00107021F9|nr:EAL domain-containing protein [Paenibacillus athensensis]MCD1261449.1 EAL domain-containing protein [Paenibacillus athensensis]